MTRPFSRPGIPWLLLLLMLCGCSKSSDYPNRPITLTCPWAAGGGTDRVSRQIAFYLEQDLGVPVNVINATGGQGVTGHARGLQARPDGYTVAMMTLELNMLHWRGLTSLDWQDCEPLMSLNEDPAALFVRSESSVASIDDLQDQVRSHPGELTASGTASLGAWHLALAGWLLAIDCQPTDIVWIPSQGASPSLQELMSGGIDVVCCSVPEARSLLDSGRIRCLAVMADERLTLPGLEDCPTLREREADWTLAGWRGLALPKGTPAEIQERLVESLRRIVTGEVDKDGQTFPEYMDGEGFDRTWRAPDDFAAFLERSDTAFGELLQRDEFQEVRSGPVGPSAFPSLAAALGACCLATIGWTRFRKGPLDTTEGTRHSAATVRGWAAFAAVPAAAALYALLAESIGFIPVSACILLSMALLLRSSVSVAVLLAVIGSPLIYVIFTSLLRVPLPPGWLG